MIAGIFNKIPYYKEVIHVAHALDGSEFIIQAGAERSIIIRIAHREALIAEVV